MSRSQLCKQVIGLRDLLCIFCLDQEFGEMVALVPENRIGTHREMLRYDAIWSAIGD